MTTKKGFTIVELVIVIAIIAILAAVLIPTFSTVIENANQSAAQSKAKNALEVVSMEVAKSNKSLTKAYIVAGNYYFVYDSSVEPALSVATAYKSTDAAPESSSIAATTLTYAKTTTVSGKVFNLTLSNVKANADIADGVYVILPGI